MDDASRNNNSNQYDDSAQSAQGGMGGVLSIDGECVESVGMGTHGDGEGDGEGEGEGNEVIIPPSHAPEDRASSASGQSVSQSVSQLVA